MERPGLARSLDWPAALTSPGCRLDELPDIDVVLISHNHYDHLDGPTIRWISQKFPNAQWLCPLGVGALLKKFGATTVIERDWWQSVGTSAFSAMCTPAQHFSARGLTDRGDTLWCGWTFEAADVRIFFAGDTGLHPEFEQIGARAGPFDLVLLPIGAYDPRWFMRSIHMNPEDAIEAYRALVRGTGQAMPCLPIHWGAFRLTDEPVTEPPTRFGALWQEAGLSADLNWTVTVGETRRIAIL